MVITAYQPVIAAYQPVRTLYQPVITAYQPVCTLYQLVITAYQPVRTLYQLVRFGDRLILTEGPAEIPATTSRGRLKMLSDLWLLSQSDGMVLGKS
eukprot:256632-Pyramimonas_sp.AAC.1